jgi:glyoxylase-like metal-dependent hydrolase (beta-lactamase superfamily II)
MAEQSVDALYEQVRNSVAALPETVPTGLVPVAPGIRVLALRTPTLPPAAHTNVYLVGPDAGPQRVVDPGSPYADQQAVLDEVLAAEAAAGRPLAEVLLTHHHGDHTGGAAALAARWQVPIAAHANTARRLAGRVAVARELGDGERIDGVECVYTPGHADGHLCFALGDAVIAGDMVAGIGSILVDPDEGDMAQYLASLRRLLARSPAVLLPAHGPAILDAPGKLREYLAHRTMREDRLVAALAARGEALLDELLPDVYADTPRILWPLAARSLRAHLDKLVHEDRASVRDGRWRPAVKSL